jgi:hypothetical protein
VNTLYLYTGHDEAPAGGANFVMRDWHVFTSTDASTFIDQGPMDGALASASYIPWQPGSTSPAARTDRPPRKA